MTTLYMQHFTSVKDAYNIDKLVSEALLMKKMPYA
ncbi:MAG: hypothetical protein RL638_2264, partial [Bacteroidota bacterium]